MARILTLPRRFFVILLALLGLAIAVPAVLVAQDVLTMSDEEQKDWLTSFVQDRLSTPERQIRLSNIDGILGSDVSVRQITISDSEGVWLRVNNARLNWNQAALFLGRLEVRSLSADSIEYVRNAVASDQVDLPNPEAGGFSVPEFPVAISLGELAIPSVTFGQSVFGLAAEVELKGNLQLEGGNLQTGLDIVRLDGPGGTLDLTIDYQKADNRIALDLSLVEPENGVIANLLNIENRPAVTLTLKGDGPVADLRTELALQANDQLALGGVATVTQSAAGFAINADLGGPLSMLMAEPYRPFFGATTALNARALLRAEGGISIEALQLSGGQLQLQATAETTTDYFLRTLVLDAAIADPNGGVVTLPVPGSATRVGSAQFNIDFGSGGSEDWSSNLSIANFETGDFGARDLSFKIGGVASNLGDPATRRVTFNGDGALSGIAAAEEIVAALGDSVGVGIAGLWNAGEPVELAQLRIAGGVLSAVLSGQLDGLDFNGDIAVETASIAPFSGMAGRDLEGALSLKASGEILPLTGGFDLTLDGTGTELSIGDELADRLLTGVVDLSGRLARTTAGLTADNFRLANDQVQLLADGNYSTDLADFKFNLDLADLALLSEEASGKLSVVGTARGAEKIIDLDLDASVANGTLSDRALRNGTIGFSGRYNVDRLDGAISGSAELDGHRTALKGDVAINSVQQALTNLDFTAVGTSISGGITRSAESGLLNGGLTIVSPDVSVAAALVLLDARGSVNAQVNLAPEAGKQSASVRGDVRDLAVNDIVIGAADIDATMADLFGVPIINGSANAANVTAAGVAIRTLTAKASQTGQTTAFDAQAALATGTDIDIAGSLTPIAEGYRLAVDRAQLVQGQLSARLAQPTVLQVVGSDVRLETVRFNVGSGSITATGSAGEQLNIDLDVSALPLSVANAVLPELGLAGTVNGRATLRGTSSDPQVGFEARIDGANAAAIREFGIAPVNASASGSFRNNIVTLSALSANGNGGLTATGSGTIPLTGNGLNVSIKGSAPLALANRFVADRGGQLSGVAELDAQVTGSLANPQFGGRVATSGAGYVDPELNARLEAITGTATLSGTNLVINTLSGNLSTGGSIAASGSIGLTGGIPADVKLALNSARYADGNLFVATVSGNLALTGNLTGSPLLSGAISVEKADITVPDTLGGGAELVDVRHRNIPAAVNQTLARAKVDLVTKAPSPQSRPAGLLLDVTLDAPNQIFIRGRGLDAEVGGSVVLKGPINNIQPVGGFSLNRGRLSILGQRINFQSGTVTLVGDLDPFLDFLATTEGQDIAVNVTVQGRVSDLRIDFSSSPQLPQDEVLARLLFNRSMGELSPLQLAKLAGAAAELVGGGSNGSLMDSLRNAAGLADLDLVTDDKGNTAVQAGTYLQDNVYLGVTAGANGQNKVTINLDVTNDLKVTGAAGQDGNSSVGVFYERDY